MYFSFIFPAKKNVLVNYLFNVPKFLKECYDINNRQLKCLEIRITELKEVYSFYTKSSIIITEYG